ncbi:MAG: DUF4956 domain-containing protein [Halioglobus sp.]|nr:DUF4956 domain-containing protein [Halioglobus sp.]
MINDLVDLSLIYGDQNPVDLAIQLLTAILLSFLVRFYYMRYAAPMGNLGNIGNVLPILSVVTFLVILIVKTSLALSLGLVGALSIVRFRAPIKDPMELTFIFIAIAIGLGTGAGKHWITTVAILIVLIIDFVRIQFAKQELHGKTLLIDIPGADGVKTAEQLLAILNEVIGSMRLSRLELGEENLTVVAQLDVVSEDDIQTAIGRIREMNNKAKCTLFDSKPVW